jgi:prepilin-type N-terminal cleavage/methylation domain-containing protein
LLQTGARRSDERGVTLLELLVTILIIGILAAASNGVFVHQRRKGWMAQVVAATKHLASGQEFWVNSLNAGGYATTLGELVEAGFRYSEDDVVPQIAAAGTTGFCLQVSSSHDPKIVWHYDSAVGRPQEGPADDSCIEGAGAYVVAAARDDASDGTAGNAGTSSEFGTSSSTSGSGSGSSLDSDTQSGSDDSDSGQGTSSGDNGGSDSVDSETGGSSGTEGSSNSGSDDDNGDSDDDNDNGSNGKGGDGGSGDGDSSEAKMTIEVGCHSVSVTSTKDISHVKVYFLDGTMREIHLTGYSYSNTFEKSIEHVSAKSGTTRISDSADNCAGIGGF